MWIVLPTLIIFFSLWLTHPQEPYGMGEEMHVCWRRAQSQWEWWRGAAILIVAGMLLILLLAHRHDIDPDMARLRNPYVGMDYSGPEYKWTLQVDGTWKMLPA